MADTLEFNEIYQEVKGSMVSEGTWGWPRGTSRVGVCWGGGRGERMPCGEEGVGGEAVAGQWWVSGVGAWGAAPKGAVVPPRFQGTESPHARLSRRTMGGCG